MSAFELGLPPSTPYPWECAHEVYPELRGDWWYCHCETCNDSTSPYRCRAEALLDAASHIRAQWPAGLRRP